MPRKRLFKGKMLRNSVDTDSKLRPSSPPRKRVDRQRKRRRLQQQQQLQQQQERGDGEEETRRLRLKT